MQSIGLIMLCIIAVISGSLLANFLDCSNKKDGNDFKIRDYIKNFKIKNIDLKYVFAFFILLMVLYKFVPMPMFMVYTLLVFALVLAFCLDVKFMIIPDTSSVIILISAILKLIIDFSKENLINSLIGFLIGGLFFVIINIVFEKITKKTGFGFGDIKLLAALGAFFGYKDIFVVIIMSIFLSAIFSIVFLVVNYFKKTKEEYLPFGPFIVISTLIICVLPASKIINAYLYLMDYFIDKLV